MDERIIRILREQAWARAKGEMDSMASTYHDEPEKFRAFYKLMNDFIQTVEDNGYAE